MDTIKVRDCWGNKRTFQATICVNGADFILKHDHWFEYDWPPPTSLESVKEGLKGEIIEEKYWKYYYKADLKIMGIDLTIERTYDEGVFVSVPGGKPVKVDANVN